MRLSPDIHPDKPVISGDFSIEVEKAVEDWLNRAVEIIRRIDNIYIKNKGVYHPGAKFADVEIALNELIEDLQCTYEGADNACNMIFEHTLMAITLALPATSPNRSGFLTSIGLILTEKGLFDQAERMVSSDNLLDLEYFHLNLLALALSQAHEDKGLNDHAVDLRKRAVWFRSAHRGSLQY